jgi:hypothetical protein
MVSVNYRVADALETLQSFPTASVSLIHLDDAWARPMRNGQFGVEYPTHSFSESDDHHDDHDTSLTTSSLIDTVRECLEPGGVLIADVDDWLLPRLWDYIQDTWGESRIRTGQVTELTQDGEPDKSTPGMYGSNGGYSVLFAWKQACPIPPDHPVGSNLRLNIPCERQRENFDWGTAKPLAPYRTYLSQLTTPGDTVVVPCAGTAPLAIAAELEYDDETVLAVECIDIEEEAREAYERRRKEELDRQVSLADF